MLPHATALAALAGSQLRSGGGGGQTGAPQQSQEMAVPNELIGCIIGKGGTKIAEIRCVPTYFYLYYVSTPFFSLSSLFSFGVTLKDFSLPFVLSSNHVILYALKRGDEWKEEEYDVYVKLILK